MSPSLPGRAVPKRQGAQTTAPRVRALLSGVLQLRRRNPLLGDRASQAMERVMEHWPAAVVASIIGLIMAVAVVAVSFRIAGPAPAYTFTNHSTAEHSTVTTVAAN
jgi:hypothetical protein